MLGQSRLLLGVGVSGNPQSLQLIRFCFSKEISLLIHTDFHHPARFNCLFAVCTNGFHPSHGSTCVVFEQQLLCARRPHRSDGPITLSVLLSVGAWASIPAAPIVDRRKRRQFLLLDCQTDVPSRWIGFDTWVTVAQKTGNSQRHRSSLKCISKVRIDMRPAWLSTLADGDAQLGFCEQFSVGVDRIAFSRVHVGCASQDNAIAMPGFERRQFQCAPHQQNFVFPQCLGLLAATAEGGFAAR